MPRYIKPTLKTKYHIDFEWWQNQGHNLRRYLLDHACEECRKMAEAEPDKNMDWVDPDTARVFIIDQLWHVVNSHCSQSPDFINDNLPLATSIFRLFITNNNTPLSAVEMHQILQKRDARTILRTISGQNVYHGIRAVTLFVSR